MSGITLGLIVFLILMVLLVIRIPIGIAMFACGAGGYLYMTQASFSDYASWNSWLSWLKNLAYARLSNYDLVVIPMFLLMGQFATHGGLSQSLFRCVNAFIGHFRGGVAMSAVGACAGFGAICGSSLATAATMGQVTLPELRRYGYSGRLSTGALAAGGTLGILIPPSVPLVLYAILTQESIGKLFVAAVIPGIIAMLGYMAVIQYVVWKTPSAGPAGEKVGWSERIKLLVKVVPVLLIFLVVIVGIYGGWANPTEAAAIGAVACGLMAMITGRLRLNGIIDCLLGTAQATAMIFLILLGADMMNAMLALSQMPVELVAWIKGTGWSPIMVLTAILIIYIALGCVMDSLAMILLTIPIFYPVIMGLDFGMKSVDQSIWFGILALMVVEIGLVHPPVGLNVYIINRLAQDVPLIETFKGVVPFLCSDFLRIILLTLFPSISLWLVYLLK